MRGIGTVVLSVAVLGCAHTQALRGPPTPKAGDVTAVVVTSLDKSDSTRVIRERDRIESIVASYAFAESGWSGDDEANLVPVYRVDFQGNSVSTYWLGVYPPAVSAPFYFYSTWWVSPTTQAGKLDRTRIKGLPDTVTFRLVRDLGL